MNTTSILGQSRVIALAILAVIAVACSSEGSAKPEGDASTDQASAAAETDTTEATTPESEDPIASGSVTILGAFTDEDGHFEEMLQAFSERSGIEIEYEGSPDFSSLAVSRVEGGNPPDILLFPQPGAVAEFASRSQILPLNDHIDRDALEDKLQAGMIDLGLVDDTLYGVPFTTNVKSLVWYPTAAFEEAGYEVPTTWEEMTALAEQIRADGVTPWCLGIESAGSTGWVATDWIEDIMLRLHGPEVYDQWTSGELAFDSPEVTQAAEVFGDLALTEGNVLGEAQGILATSFRSAPAPMFEDPPACYLHRQASFIVGSFPEEAEFGTDYDMFFLPPMQETGDYGGRPLLGGGDIASLATDNPAAVAVLEHLTTPEAFLESRAGEGGTLSAYRAVSPEDYPLPVDQAQAHILQAADVFRFDGSDLMPTQVGAGAFWSEMVAWINGEKQLQDALAAIDQAWPQ